jgi:hypothetical protein
MLKPGGHPSTVWTVELVAQVNMKKAMLGAMPEQTVVEITRT